ncbi:Zn(2)-C6 fungal-specific transcription factor [Phycomyces blakesleeanus NRRL 1555(-)]|uniref:Zn(2)-C6 fungal-specific transcription factor n=1 Tax=Phycomyces blakesleeanus (strain ATCC 8743b / DSM 1359 / FGSC 10004 / NBRC 33097 / NRRL 1555) TaxID=763407 RepID=A0A167M0V3_PHYB8|nr:Zn(2)-C6 fungal-specific transcription factor [Phycomyces blakesleeanus NRRL 1555(-)]OAD71479.1 Zn(2)-C6 fungal-specific transcription factor [Phycomyces blakesleeanus NRRL 1555(-)]|eukprot:XP_018289519.1 Zn(2)-C6 fungal-specific transcription factor [Phycomyces blakesleeanus NRRL 1555(-)]
MSSPANQGSHQPQNMGYKQPYQNEYHSSHGNFPGILPMPAPYPKPIDIHRVKRTRAKRSCDMCRKKKTRCDVDVNKPCTTCRTAKTECQFIIEQKKRGPATGSYVEALESRLRRMETLLEKMATSKGAESETNSCSSPKLTFANSPTKSPSPSPNDAGSPNDRGSPGRGPSCERDQIHKSTSILNLTPCEDDPQRRPFNPGDSTDMIPIVLGRNLYSSEKTFNPANASTSNELSQHMNALTITDYDRTRYIGASSGLHMLNQELLQSNKRHRLVDHPSWIVQKLNDDVDEHVIMKTEEINKAKNHKRLPLVVERFSFFEDIPNMTQELADAMVHHYFTHVHAYCPILNKIGFLEQYYYHNPNPPDEYLLYAICAIGARFINFESQIDLREYCNISTEDLRTLQVTLLTRAREILGVVYKRSRVGSVQTLLILTMFVEDSDDDAEDTSHWFITGMAQDLGLHRNSGRWQIPEHEIELRRRIWFAVYAMDRWVAAEMGRPITILDHEFDVELPTPYEIETTHRTPTCSTQHMDYKPTLICEAEKAIKEKRPIYDPFLYSVTLSQILGQILVGLYSPKAKHTGRRNASLVAFLDSNLKNWRINLPPSIRIDCSAGESLNLIAVIGMLNMCYNCVLILLHRPFIVKDENENMTSAFQSLSTCTAAAGQLLDVVEQMECEIFQSIPWSIAVYSIFQAAIIFLHNAKGENPYISIDGTKNLKRCSRLFQRDINISSTRIAKVLSSLVATFSVFTDDEDMSECDDTNSDDPDLGNKRQLVVNNSQQTQFRKKRNSSQQLRENQATTGAGGRNSTLLSSTKKPSMSSLPLALKSSYAGDESSVSSETHSHGSPHHLESSPEPASRHSLQCPRDDYRFPHVSVDSLSASTAFSSTQNNYSSNSASGNNSPRMMGSQYSAQSLDPGIRPEDHIQMQMQNQETPNYAQFPCDQPNSRLSMSPSTHSVCPIPDNNNNDSHNASSFFQRAAQNSLYTSELLGNPSNHEVSTSLNNSNNGPRPGQGSTLTPTPMPTPTSSLSTSYPFLTSMMTDTPDPQFDIDCLNSQVPLWDLPSGVTWDEWDSFIKSNIQGNGSKRS